MRKTMLNVKFVSVLALWMCLLSIPPTNAFAMPSESIAAVSLPSVRQAQIDNIMFVLSRPDVRAHLVLAGIDQKALEAKLSQLNDKDLASVAQKTQTIKAGGDALGLIVVLLVIAILVVLLMKLSNRTVSVR